MHLLIASFMCYVLLLTDGNAEGGEGYQFEQNVPKIVRNSLLDAITESRRNSGLEWKKIEYDEELAKKLLGGTTGRLMVLDGESTFTDNWNDTLKEAIKSKGNENGMVRVAEKIGCEIKLRTSDKDGSHKVDLRCLLELV